MWICVKEFRLLYKIRWCRRLLPFVFYVYGATFPFHLCLYRPQVPKHVGAHTCTLNGVSTCIPRRRICKLRCGFFFRFEGIFVGCVQTNMSVFVRHAQRSERSVFNGRLDAWAMIVPIGIDFWVFWFLRKL